MKDKQQEHPEDFDIDDDMDDDGERANEKS